jgi:ankyrin repeat domain-containing protein 50
MQKRQVPKYYSETALQPVGAVGIPSPLARLVDRQKEHDLSLHHAKEKHEHTRSLEETSHRDSMRRSREAQDAELAAATAAEKHRQTLEAQRHDFEVQRVQAAEAMKRHEKTTWHNLIMEQERDAAARRQSVDDRKAGAAAVAEARLIDQRKAE